MLRGIAGARDAWPGWFAVPLAEALNRLDGAADRSAALAGRPERCARPGRPRTRMTAIAERAINPSRLIDTLVRRGLVERSAYLRGYVRLTDAGVRELAERSP